MTIAKELWGYTYYTGKVERQEGCIVATYLENIDSRSEASFMQDIFSGRRRYWFSFKLEGEHSDRPTIILQFHDWWKLPDNIAIEGFPKGKKVYCATNPPVALLVKGGDLIIQTNQIGGQAPLLNMEKGWLELKEKNLLEYKRVQEVPLNEWVDLEIEIDWAQDKTGEVLYNGVAASNIATMFNSNPCQVQCGLYMKSQLTKNTIREFRYEDVGMP